jgi:hypothetical protein
MRRLPFVACNSDIKVLGEIGWHKVPWFTFREDFADALNTASHKSRAYLLPVNTETDLRSVGANSSLAPA